MPQKRLRAAKHDYMNVQDNTERDVLYMLIYNLSKLSWCDFTSSVDMMLVNCRGDANKNSSKHHSTASTDRKGRPISSFI